MTAYVVAHGWYDSSAPTKIKVPAGMKLSFLANVDLAGLHNVQAAQMIVGGVASADLYGEGEEVDNYQFSPFESDRVDRLIALNQHGLDLWVIGDQGVAANTLCPGDEACTDDEHVCKTGLLGIARDEGVKHLHFLTCRVDNAPGHEAWKGDETLHMESGDDSSWHAELKAWTIRFTTLDFAAQRREWEALDYEYQVYCTTDEEIEQWSKVYEAVMAHEAGEATFGPHLASMSGPVKERLLREHPEVAETVRAMAGDIPDEYTEYVDGFVTWGLPERDTAWKQIDAEQRQVMMLDPRMADWAQAYNVRELIRGDIYSRNQYWAVYGNLTPGAREVMDNDPQAVALYNQPD